MSNTPKDSAETKIPDVNPIEAPGGLDLHPTPQTSVRVSKRASLAIGAVILGVLLAFIYGGYRRQVLSQAAARDSGLPKAVMPATESAHEVERNVPSGNAPLVRNDPDQLQPPDAGKGPHTRTSMPSTASCGFDPRTGQPYRFNPDTGQPCTGYPQDRVVVRQPAYPRAQATPASTEPTPEERRIAAAYRREQEAMIAPTGIHTASGAVSFASFPGAGGPAPRNDDLAQVAALSQSLAGRGPTTPAATAMNRFAASSSSVPSSDPDYEGQNMQSAKASFLATAQQQKTDDYLRSTRTPPFSAYEIMAGWEIPAVLEQSLNSDLPGEIKALIASNVFDTATGRYLLVPQGARLVGRYDSRISYGQDGVQVIWDRIVFPDASSVDINGMVGLDAHGNSGLRYDVDHHYKRLFGFAALTSAFSAAFDLSQRSTQSALTYPSVTDTATASVGREMSQTGAMIARRNLNVQPTIKVPVGYQFTVRVNRDILFDAPYQPVQANPGPIQPPGQLRRRSGFSTTDYGQGR